MSLVWQRRGGGRVLRPQGALHRGLSLALAPTGSPRAEGEELVLSLDRKTNDPIMGA